MKIALFAAAVASLVATAPAGAAASAYDQGLQAFRAHDYVTAQAQWRKAADEGDPAATSQLGVLLARGLGSPPDEIGAVALWLAAADAGATSAQAHLGRAARDGVGMPRNLPMAYARLRCAVAAADRHPQDRAEADVRTEAAADLAVVAGSLTTAEAAAGQRLADECIASLPAGR